MAFSDIVKHQALRRAGGKCERCKRTLAILGTEYHHKLSESAGGTDGLANCEVLCLVCHKKTKSFGAH